MLTLVLEFMVWVLFGLLLAGMLLLMSMAFTKTSMLVRIVASKWQSRQALDARPAERRTQKWAISPTELCGMAGEGHRYASGA